MKLRTLLPAAFMTLLVCTSFALQAQDKGPKLYKWVDKQGIVHYGSSIPPEYAGQQKQVLNSEGITVQTISGQKSPEELAREAQQKAAAEQQVKQAQQQRANDQMLLDTYSSVADIEHDRDDRVATLTSQINVTSTTVAGLTNTLAGYQQSAARLEQQGKPVPDALQKNLHDTKQSLLADQQLLMQQQQEKSKTEARFQDYIKRFKELTAPADTPPGG